MGQMCDQIIRLSGTTIANSTTDFFTALSFAPGWGAKVVTISVTLDTSVKLYARINGANMAMNSDTALTANALYTFSFILTAADTLTFRTSAACVVTYMSGIVSIE